MALKFYLDILLILSIFGYANRYAMKKINNLTELRRVLKLATHRISPAYCEKMLIEIMTQHQLGDPDWLLDIIKELPIDPKSGSYIPEFHGILQFKGYNKPSQIYGNAIYAEIEAHLPQIKDEEYLNNSEDEAIFNKWKEIARNKAFQYLTDNPITYI